MKRSILAAVVAGALALAPAAGSADEPEPGAVDDVQGDALARVRAFADEHGVPLDELLATEIPMRTDDGQPAPMTLEQLLATLEGARLQDDAWSGVAQTPQLAAGNVMHVFATLAFHRAPRDHQPDLSAYRYQVRELEQSPDTPLVAVPNPLLAAGNPGGLPPVLGFHAGGKAKHVRAAGYLMGYHSAGTTPIGSNADTAPREPAPGDTVPAPVYVPFAHEGTLMLADRSIDFVGFARAVSGGDCSKVDIPFTGDAFFLCAGGGLLLGDGAANFDGGPVPLGALVP